MLGKASAHLFIALAIFIFYIASPLSTYALTYTNNMSASVVVGQRNFTENTADGLNTNSRGFNYNTGMTTVGTRLIVADCNNHRVLIYNSIPTSNNIAADVVIGQADMSGGKNNQGGNVGANTLYCPEFISTDGTKLFIADYNNNRVLIYNSIPTSNNASADVVIGQPNMTSNLSNQDTDVGANTLSFPTGVSYDSSTGKLIITDNANSRVLIYNTVPTSNNASANVVIGQQNMTSNSFNQGGTPAANTLNRPFNARIIDNKLLVVDQSNHRVLIYNTIPTSNNASANIVIGQTGMTGGGPNQNSSVGANTLSYPYDIYWDGSRLLTLEEGNNRVLIFYGLPSSNNTSANSVIGQTNFTNTGGGTSTTKLNCPAGQLLVISGTLFVGDSCNNRVVAYNDYVNSGTATLVIGQPSFTSSYTDQTQIPNARGIETPTGVVSDGKRLIIAECNNNRVLIYNSIPTSNDITADVVIGQQNMTSSSVNQGGSAAANTLNCPQHVFIDGNKLFVADNSNNRVLIYNSIPTSNNSSANVVIGQTSMSGSSQNQGGSVGANTLSSPSYVYYDSSTDKLFISDNSNNRVLIYNSIPTSNNASANVVIGQVNMTGSSENQGGGGSASANTLSFPTGILVAQNKLLIADSNNRVLIYNSIPTSNNASANVVIGQTGMTGSSQNQGGSANANTLAYPTDLTYDSEEKLLISDVNNSRVLVYNSIPTSNNASANVVIGQASMTESSANQGGNYPAANTLKNPNFVYFNNDKLFISDYNNHRILIYYAASIASATSSPLPNANYVGGFKYEILAGGQHQGSASFIFSSSVTGGSYASTLIGNDASVHSLFIRIETKTLDELSAGSVPFPWSQGLNSVGDIFDFQSLSAFNGYPISSFDKPVTIIVPYDLTKLKNVSEKNLRIAYYDKVTKRWRILYNNTVLNTKNHTLANTFTKFSYFTVVNIGI